jgi:hypothetical protein
MTREKPIYADTSGNTEGLRKFLRILEGDSFEIIKECQTRHHREKMHRDFKNANRPPVQA